MTDLPERNRAQEERSRSTPVTRSCRARWHRDRALSSSSLGPVDSVDLVRLIGDRAEEEEEEEAMKYMLLIHQGTTPTPRGPEAWATLSEDEQKAVFADYEAINETAGVTPGFGLDPSGSSGNAEGPTSSVDAPTSRQTNPAARSTRSDRMARVCATVLGAGSRKAPLLAGVLLPRGTELRDPAPVRVVCAGDFVAGVGGNHDVHRSPPAERAA